MATDLAVVVKYVGCLRLKLIEEGMSCVAYCYQILTECELGEGDTDGVDEKAWYMSTLIKKLKNEQEMIASRVRNCSSTGYHLRTQYCTSVIPVALVAVLFS